MPPDEYRNEGTPSLSEGPDARGEPFFAYFFLAFEKKVSRRKGETLSSRYRSNGYTPNLTDNKKAPEGAFRLQQINNCQAISAVVSKSKVSSPSLRSM
jgi:hypothetical protein